MTFPYFEAAFDGPFRASAKIYYDDTKGSLAMALKWADIEGVSVRKAPLICPAALPEFLRPKTQVSGIVGVWKAGKHRDGMGMIQIDTDGTITFFSEAGAGFAPGRCGVCPGSFTYFAR